MRIYPVLQKASQIHPKTVIISEKPHLPSLSLWQSVSTCQRGQSFQTTAECFCVMLPFLLGSVVQVFHTNQTKCVRLCGSLLGLSILLHRSVCCCVNHTLLGCCEPPSLSGQQGDPLSTVLLRCLSYTWTLELPCTLDTLPVFSNSSLAFDCNCI